MELDENNPELMEQIEAARERGRLEALTLPAAARVYYDAGVRQIVIKLKSGAYFSFPPSMVKELNGANEYQLATVKVLGLGVGIHWESLDVSLSVPELIAQLSVVPRI